MLLITLGGSLFFATALLILLDTLKNIDDPSERTRQTSQALSRINEIAAIRVDRAATP